MKAPPAIALPQGVKDILPEESAAIVAVESAVLGVFGGHGFKRVITPLLEYADVLSVGVGEELKDKTLKFIDPSTGRVVAIRPDITPQIARVVATRMRDYELPLKLCYNENVIRYHEPRDGKSIEVLQIGAEFVTAAPTAEADAEMITMAVEALKAAGLEGFKIDIGDVGFFRSILDGLGVRPGERRSIKEAVARKDSSTLESVLGSLETGISPEDKKTLIALTTFYGEEEVFEKAASFARDERAMGLLENLKGVFRIITDKGLRDYVTVDLGEVRGFDYYTGIMFEGFSAGVGRPILSGGRYDTLTEKYGYKAAATGFAFDVESIVEALAKGRKRG